MEFPNSIGARIPFVTCSPPFEPIVHSVFCRNERSNEDWLEFGKRTFACIIHWAYGNFPGSLRSALIANGVTNVILTTLPGTINRITVNATSGRVIHAEFCVANSTGQSIKCSNDHTANVCTLIFGLPLAHTHTCGALSAMCLGVFWERESFFFVRWGSTKIPSYVMFTPHELCTWISHKNSISHITSDKWWLFSVADGSVQKVSFLRNGFPVCLRNIKTVNVDLV